MAIGQKVETHNGKFEIELPDGTKTGVVWQIQSRNAPKPKEVERKIGLHGMAKSVAAGKATDDPTSSEDWIAHVLENNTKVLAACVTGWDWGDEEFREGEGAPEFSYENVIDIIESPEGEYITGQLASAVAELGKPKAAPKKSA